MLVSPEDDRDPNARITNIQVFDSRYLTDKGLSTASTFADVKANYTIASIENAINSVVVFLADSDIYLTIDKKELPEDLRYNYNARIEATQIPDEATIKYFMIGWDHSEDDNSTDQQTKTHEQTITISPGHPGRRHSYQPQILWRGSRL